MNGQRFHQQKRIEMKTEQCERSLRLPDNQIWPRQEICINAVANKFGSEFG